MSERPRHSVYQGGYVQAPKSAQQKTYRQHAVDNSEAVGAGIKSVFEVAGQIAKFRDASTEQEIESKLRETEASQTEDWLRRQNLKWGDPDSPFDEDGKVNQDKLAGIIEGYQNQYSQIGGRMWFLENAQRRDSKIANYRDNISRTVGLSALQGDLKNQQTVFNNNFKLAVLNKDYNGGLNTLKNALEGGIIDQSAYNLKAAQLGAAKAKEKHSGASGVSGLTNLASTFQDSDPFEDEDSNSAETPTDPDYQPPIFQGNQYDLEGQWGARDVQSGKLESQKEEPSILNEYEQSILPDEVAMDKGEQFLTDDFIGNTVRQCVETAEQPTLSIDPQTQTPFIVDPVDEKTERAILGGQLKKQGTTPEHCRDLVISRALAGMDDPQQRGMSKEDFVKMTTNVLPKNTTALFSTSLNAEDDAAIFTSNLKEISGFIYEAGVSPKTVKRDLNLSPSSDGMKKLKTQIDNIHPYVKALSEDPTDKTNRQNLVGLWGKEAPAYWDEYIAWQKSEDGLGVSAKGTRSDYVDELFFSQNFNDHSLHFAKWFVANKYPAIKEAIAEKYSDLAAEGYTTDLFMAYSSTNGKDVSQVRQTTLNKWSAFDSNLLETAMNEKASQEKSTSRKLAVDHIFNAAREKAMIETPRARASQKEEKDTQLIIDQNKSIQNADQRAKIKSMREAKETEAARKANPYAFGISTKMAIASDEALTQRGYDADVIIPEAMARDAMKKYGVSGDDVQLVVAFSTAKNAKKFIAQAGKVKVPTTNGRVFYSLAGKQFGVNTKTSKETLKRAVNSYSSDSLIIVPIKKTK